jgi:uncharacterized protein (DUF2147 family)
MELRRTAGIAGLAAAMQFGGVAQAVPQAAIEGVWQTPEQSELTISACDEGFCGHLSKIVVPHHIAARYGAELAALTDTFTDANNKDPALRQRPIQGLRILVLRPGSEPWRYEGEIYNPEDGNLYSGSVELMSADTMRLKGCVLYVLCQEQEWHRVPPPAEPAAE